MIIHNDDDHHADDDDGNDDDDDHIHKRSDSKYKDRANLNQNNIIDKEYCEMMMVKKMLTMMVMMMKMMMAFPPWKAVPLPGNPASLANATSSGRWVWTSRKFVIIIICNYGDDDNHDHQMMIN